MRRLAGANNSSEQLQFEAEMAWPRNINAFLTAARAHLRTLPNANSAARTHLVLGNDGCDLDSMVCAVVYAFHLHCQSRPSSSIVVAPLLNCRRAAFRLRGEAPLVFAAAGIDVDALPFLDDVGSDNGVGIAGGNDTGNGGHDVLAAAAALCLQRQRQTSAATATAPVADRWLRVTLVDHNALAPAQRFLAPHVDGVIDHHVDEQCMYGGGGGGGDGGDSGGGGGGGGGGGVLTVRVIEPVGSCASLVTRLIGEVEPSLLSPAIGGGSDHSIDGGTSTSDGGDGDDGDIILATGRRLGARSLLLAAVLLDTRNMATTGKGTPADAAAMQMMLSPETDVSNEKEVNSNGDSDVDCHSVGDSVGGGGQGQGDVRACAPARVDTAALERALRAARGAVAHLSLCEKLEKDTKRGVVVGGGGGGGDIRFAIASLPQSIQDMIAQHVATTSSSSASASTSASASASASSSASSSFCSELRVFCRQNRVDLLVIMTQIVDAGKKGNGGGGVEGGGREMRRQLAFFRDADDDAARDTFLDAVTAAMNVDDGGDALQLAGDATFKADGLRVFEQGNVRASRKQVMPRLTRVLHQTRPATRADADAS
jgi:inorganic pyrophosphatase/exopolyphosphatase